MVSKHHIVTEFNSNIEHLSGYAIVVKTKNLDLLNEINNIVNRNNKLHCVVLFYHGRLSTFPTYHIENNTPIHLFAREMGNFKEIAPLLNFFRSLSIRIFLSSEIPENYVNLQILASLGINCGIYFNNHIDWDLLNDLMCYAAYSKVKKATIEPFNYIIDQYNPNDYTDMQTVYFNNPLKYIHLDPIGRIALTEEDLKNERFISEKIQDIPEITKFEYYHEKTTKFKDDFLNLEGCASCLAWRICLGYFKNFNSPTQCQGFMTDLLEACEIYYQKRKELKNKELCQP